MTGPLPTFAWADLLTACPALDSVLCGEVEASAVILASSLAQPGTWRRVPGLAYRAPAPRANPLNKAQLDLDHLPFPAWDDGIPSRLGFGFVTVGSSRGCYHACTFCLPCALHRAHATSPHRTRSVNNMVEEIEALYQRGARLFLFDDEQFLAPGSLRVNQINEWRDQLRQREMDIAFTIKCRPDDVEEMLFRELREMGLIRVYLGIESGCQATLNLLGKGTTVGRNAEALAVLDALDIVADFRTLLFQPWSTLETIRQDLGFLRSVLPHVPTAFAFHEVECYPGTPLAERLTAEGRGDGNPWPLSYTIGCPQAELLRRLGRVVFGARNADGICNQLTEAWFDVLLLRRFLPDRSVETRARALRDAAARLNAETVAVWQEMLSVVERGNVHDTESVNEHVAAWAAGINAFDMTLEEELAQPKECCLGNMVI